MSRSLLLLLLAAPSCHALLLLQPPRPLLQLARERRDKVALHAGFIPRSYARMVMRESAEVALAAEAAAPAVETQQGALGRIVVPLANLGSWMLGRS